MRPCLQACDFGILKVSPKLEVILCLFLEAFEDVPDLGDLIARKRGHTLFDAVQVVVKAG